MPSQIKSLLMSSQEPEFKNCGWIVPFNNKYKLKFWGSDSWLDITASIPVIDKNGNWFIDGLDTGYKAVGIDGKSFDWKGQWITNKPYKLNNVVYNNGNGYICIKEHISEEFNADVTIGCWDLFVSKGDDIVNSWGAINGNISEQTDLINLLSHYALLNRSSFTGQINTKDVDIDGVLKLGNDDTVISRQSAGILQVNDNIIPTISNSCILQNKRIKPRVYKIDTIEELSPDTDLYNVFSITNLSTSLMISKQYNSIPFECEQIIIKIKDNGTSQTIQYDNSYNANGNQLPSNTIVGKTLYLYFLWNTDTSKWDYIK